MSQESSNAPDGEDGPIIGSTSLDSLQTADHQKLLDQVDKMRSYGINEFVSLPQLVVCGDQSSGKSSVLEAITEIPFPRRSNLCTRFVTQIVLRRRPMVNFKVKIIPHHSRLPEQKSKLLAFDKTIDDFSGLPSLIDAAGSAMGLDLDGDGAFSRDTLSIEVSGPDKPQLTIVDTPGLIHSENKLQSSMDIEIVRDLVKGLIAEPRTIILPVVSAKYDAANQEILQLAKNVDRTGSRTLGIITKPDTIEEGVESEFLALARNQDIALALGWHVLRNRSYDERESSFEERNLKEARFFQRGPWNALPRENIGIEQLRSRLSLLLFKNIQQELPRVYQEVLQRLEDTKQEISMLGKSRSTLDDQKLLLFNSSAKFFHLCKASVDGTYDDPFFRINDPLHQIDRRLRAVVQQLNYEFAGKMRTEGEQYQLVSGTFNHFGKKSRSMTRLQMVNWVKLFLEKGRGRELPGSYSPLIIGELFCQQSEPWEDIAFDHLASVWNACSTFIEQALQEVVPLDVFAPLASLHIEDKMEERFKAAEYELKQLLEDRQGHAITYSQIYPRQYEKFRADRLNEKVVAVAVASSTATPVKKSVLNEAKVSDTSTNADNEACEELLDSMLAYYKVTRERFIDNIAVLVIERHCLRNLWDIYSPAAVHLMAPELVSSIARESSATSQLRTELESRKPILEQGVDVCKQALKGSAQHKIHLERRPKISKNLGRAEDLKESVNSTPELNAKLPPGPVTKPHESNVSSSSNFLSQSNPTPSASSVIRSASPAPTGMFSTSQSPGDSIFSKPAAPSSNSMFKTSQANPAKSTGLFSTPQTPAKGSGFFNSSPSPAIGSRNPMPITGIFGNQNVNRK